MARFRPGQEVVCISDKDRCICHKHPKEGEIVTVHSYCPDDDRWLSINEYYHSWYAEDDFEELPTMEEINEALEVLVESN